jgi:ABC-type polysaccharide/polyol phosphate export permease
MGLLWAVLMPSAIVIAGVVVRLVIAKAANKSIVMSEMTPVFVKSVAWAFFVASLRSATNCLVGNANLVTRIYFPRLVLPFAAVVANCFDFAVASCVLVLVLAVSGVSFSATMLWAPLLLVSLFVLTAGLVIFLSAAGLFLRDVNYLVQLYVMFAIFATPVYYSASIFGRWAWVLLLNPVAPLLEGLSDAVVLGHTPNLAWLSYSIAASSAIFVGAVAIFRHLEARFAECI